MRSFYVFCLLLLLPFSSVCQTPPPAADTPNPANKFATVAGTVLGLDTGAPLKRARVTLQNRSDFQKSVYDTTDEQGHFRFDAIEPGSFDLVVSHNGYVDAEFGEKKPGGPGAVLTLHPGQQMTDLIFKLSRAAVISGHVYDEDGEPASGAEVRVFQASEHEGQERPVSEQPVASNDLGEFRIFGLSPGRYYVSVSYPLDDSRRFLSALPKQKTSMGYLPSYYPNTTDPTKAQRIIVRAGDELRSVDFFLRPGHVLTVSGKVVLAVPVPPSSVGTAGVYIYPRAPGLAQAVMSLNSTVHRKDGSFEIHNVPPGSYYIVASCRDGDLGAWLATRRELDMSSLDVDGVVLTISRGVDIPGRVSWEGTSPRDLQDAYVILSADDKSLLTPPAAQVKPDGSFLLKSVPEGVYQLSVRQPGRNPPGFLKSARYANTSVTDKGFMVRSGSDSFLDLLMSPRSAQVSGLVLTGDSLPAVGVRVVLVPDEPRRSLRWKFLSETTDQNGSFALTGIEPGDYKLFSWESAEEGDWFDEAWLKPYESKGVSVHLEESDHRSVELNLIEASKETPAIP